jgi:general secretion pathway protein D
LIIVASRQDYETIKNLLAKIDIARDQVFIKAIIMELSAETTNDWKVDAYKFMPGTNGIGRFGFRGSNDIQQLINPSTDNGAVLGFGTGGTTTIEIANQKFTVPSLLALVKLLTSHNNGQILSTPQIMALDNEESMIEVGSKVPVGLNSTPSTTGVVTQNIDRQPVTTKLTITPYISPDTDTVQMKIDQEVADVLPQNTIGASQLAQTAIATSTRRIKTQIVVNSGDTAVLGGLMKDEDKEVVQKVPILGDIPILGWLFKSDQKTKKKQNLVVFITPKIVRNPADSSEIVDQKLSERIDFIQQNLQGRDVHGKYVDALPRAKKSATKESKPESPAVETF